jgi:tetratricopeptide (TPR) repeat protein
VLRAQPQNAGALHTLGVLSTQAGNAQRALELIARSIAIDPNQAAAYSNLGNALMTLGRHREAVELFDRALGFRPRYATALFTRHIEDAYTQMYERYQADLNPDHIEVPQ